MRAEKNVCPNCDSLVKEVVNLRHELNMAHLLIVDLYNSAHREGWEPGESIEELCDRTHSYLCNWGLDPYTNGGPERIKQLRKAIAPPFTEPKEGEK